MAERESLFERVREALRSPRETARRDGSGPSTRLRVLPEVQRADPRPWLPIVGATPDEWIAQFAQFCETLKTEFVRCPTEREAHERVRELADSSAWVRVACHGNGLASRAAGASTLPLLRVDEGYDKRELESCSVGVTECDALIAQTGSILLTARSAGGRALSVYPPHHVVVATVDQVVPDLPTAFERLESSYAPNYPSLISLVTGPSRTGDIERVIVLGAHGPKRLTVLLIG